MLIPESSYLDGGDCTFKTMNIEMHLQNLLSRTEPKSVVYYQRNVYTT